MSNLLRKHGMHGCKAASSPLVDKVELCKDQMPEDGSDEQQQMTALDYRGLVGSIAYLSLSTRPDLAFAAHQFSRFLSNPGMAHWQAAKHVLRYLRGTTDVGIKFSNCEDVSLIGYTDSDYASCRDDRRRCRVGGASLAFVLTWAVGQSHGLLDNKRAWLRQLLKPKCMH